MKNTDANNKKRIVAISDKAEWNNAEFLKDCCLVPYLLYKNHNCEVTFVGAKFEEWPYLETHLKGVKADVLPHGTPEEKQLYILNHALNIDCLILRGAYEQNFALALLYKEHNPNGKIYLGLDANSYWMDFLEWNHPVFRAFMDACDVIGTSCTAVQMHLNEKWPWKVEHFPNGCYDFEKQDVMPDFSKKENHLLTVSRLGTPAKANHIMLEAFALIADQIPDWKFYLVGPVADEFQPFIQSYYERFPELQERVIFTGPVFDKPKLKEIYLKSKIFVLSSTSEGGTPNVIGEALGGGCVIATTKIDAWAEAINYGKCGLACNKKDIEGLSNILLELCVDTELQHKSEEAYRYSQKEMNLEKIVARLYLAIFGEES